MKLLTVIKENSVKNKFLLKNSSYRLKVIAAQHTPEL